MDFKPEFSWQFLPTEQITAKTIRALRNHIKHLKAASPFYREVLYQIEPQDISTLEDFAGIPFTDRQALSENWSRFVSEDQSGVAETVLTSGATGKPLPFFYTRNDLDRLAYGEALSLHCCGVELSDRAQIVLSMDRFCAAGLSFYRGMVLLGANVARAGMLTFEMQKGSFEMLRPTVLMGVASQMRKMGRDLLDKGYDPKQSSVKKLICTAESIYDQNLELGAVARDLENLWGAKVSSVYHNTEASASFSDCPVRKGLHCRPELVHVEIIGPQGEILPEGVPGELVLTPLGSEALPLLRYRTGDITYIVPGNCECGRNSVRIGPVLGRKTQLINVNGNKIYPLNVMNALDSVEEVLDYVVILENDNTVSDRVSVHVAAPASAVEKIANQLRSMAKVSFPILISNLTTIHSLRTGSRKKEHLIDWRHRNR